MNVKNNLNKLMNFDNLIVGDFNRGSTGKDQRRCAFDHRGYFFRRILRTVFAGGISRGRRIFAVIKGWQFASRKCDSDDRCERYFEGLS